MECGVRKGLDRILENPAAFPRAFEAGTRLGFITSDGSPPGPWGMGSGSIQTARDALIGAGAPLTHLFTPEHGLSAMAPDGAPVGDGRDEVTGLPVTSLEIGGADISAFVGVNGPYWTDVDGDGLVEMIICKFVSTL